MGVILASNSLLTEADETYELSLVHNYVSGPGSGGSTALTSVDRLRTRQLADAFRVEHSNGGAGLQERSVIRLNRVDNAVMSLAGRLGALLGIDCADPAQTFELSFTYRDSALDVISHELATPTVYPVSAERGLQAASYVVGPMSQDAEYLDINIRPVMASYSTPFSIIFDVGRFFLADDFWESSSPLPGSGWQEDISEDGVLGLSRGRQGFGDSEIVYRALQFRATRLTQASKDTLKRLIARVGRTRELIFAHRVGSTGSIDGQDPGMLYGHFTQSISIRRQGGPFFEAEFAMAEEF